jgi:hypothetical protein
MVAVDLLEAGSAGIGACWGWQLAPLRIRGAAELAWAAGTIAAVAALAAVAGPPHAELAALAGAAAGWGAHRAWRLRLRRTAAP